MSTTERYLILGTAVVVVLGAILLALGLGGLLWGFILFGAGFAAGALLGRRSRR